MAQRYKGDTTADVLEALSLITATATNVHAANVAAKMDAFRIEAEQESRLKEVELQGTISEFYDLKKEREQVAATLRKEYPKLGQKFISNNFAPIVDTFEGVAENDMSNLQNNMNQLLTDITNLKGLEQQLAEQKSYYKGQEQAIAGLTRLVDPGEFEGLVEEYKEKFPGAPTAGLYAGYEAGRVDAYRRGEAKDKMQATSKAFAQSNWQGILQLATGDEFDVDAYTDNELLQSEIAKMISFQNYPDALNYMNIEPTGKVKDVFYDMFPGLMASMEGHVASVDIIESEFLGKEKETVVDNATNNLLSKLDNVTNKEAFILYDQQLSLLTNNADKIAMFAEMEKKLGKGDLREEYKIHLGMKSTFDPKQPIGVSLMAPVLEQYEGTSRQQAEQIYEVLNTIEDPGAIESIRDLSMNISSRGAVDVAGKGILERPLYTAGKAFLGGQLGVDSPYYDAFYNSMDEQMGQIVAEEDPFGPDFLYYGLDEEHVIPEIMRDRYGDEIYNEAITIADQIGREAQIKELETVLKSKTGEDYRDLIRILNSLGR